MRRLYPAFLLVPLLLAACGSDSNPAAPSDPVMDEITVSLDQINVVKDCDAGASDPGEFAYRFYVIVYEDDVETARYLDSGWSSSSVNDNTSWDPGSYTTFTLERSSHYRFQVRLQVRELDSIEDFSQGTFISHVNESGRAPWSPSSSSGVTDYTLYDANKMIGQIDWDYWARSDCNGSLTYTVSVVPASSTP